MAAALTHRPFAIQKWGDALRMARLKKVPPMSVRDLADRCGVGKKVAEAWEAGEEHPTRQQLTRLHASLPAMEARIELWRNETAFAKPTPRGLKPLPEAKREQAPPAEPALEPLLKPEVVVTRAEESATPARPVSPPPEPVSDVAAAGVRYAVALAEVKAARDHERRAAAEHAAAVRAAADAMTQAQERLQQKLAAAEAAKKALDEAVEND